MQEDVFLWPRSFSLYSLTRKRPLNLASQKLNMSCKTDSSKYGIPWIWHFIRYYYKFLIGIKKQVRISVFKHTGKNTKNGNDLRQGRILKQVYTILYTNNLQFHPDGCSSFLPVNLLKESDVGSWTVVSFIIIYIIKITPSEKKETFCFVFQAHVWFHGYRLQNKWFSSFFCKIIFQLIRWVMAAPDELLLSNKFLG